jgi:AcrR family transcriptional regulator
MTEEIAGRGDPIKTLQLLWGMAEPPRRGPRPKVSLTDLVAAAVAIADTEGLGAVSTRRVAEAVGISPMSFYTHVPGKAELLDLMLDAVATGDREAQAHALPQGATWRDKLTLVAQSLWHFYLRHPWVLELATHRPVLGPNTLAAYEFALAAVDGIGLDPIEMDMSFTLVANYVHGAVRDAAREKLVKEATGMSDDEWWQRVAPFLATLDFSPYPTTARVGPVVGEAHGAHNPEGAFAFGLQRILDGLELFIASKQRQS